MQKNDFIECRTGNITPLTFDPNAGVNPQELKKRWEEAHQMGLLEEQQETPVPEEPKGELMDMTALTASLPFSKEQMDTMTLYAREYIARYMVRKPKATQEEAAAKAKQAVCNKFKVRIK